MVKEAPVLDQILLIDDNSFINFLNKNTIMEMGIARNIHVFNDGFEGLNYLKECKAKNDLPDLILLDVIMPIIDGNEFFKWLKLLDLLNNSNTKIVALTGGGNHEKITEMTNLGLDAIIYKPLDKARFLEVINRLFK